MNPAKKPCIALLIGEMEHGYSYQGIIWKTALEEAARLGVTLRVMVGHRIHPYPHVLFCDTGIYRMASRLGADGIIITPPVAQLLDSDACRKLAAETGGLPIVFLGMEVEGFPSVMADNNTGFRKLMNLVCSREDNRDILHLAGPAENQEARIREEEFQDALTRHGRDPGPHRILRGDFSSGCVAPLLDAWVAQGGPIPDALVAANDQMAVAVLEWMKDRGLVIPDRVRIYGYDDIRMSRDCSPPLTTVNQRVEYQVRLAMEGLATILKGHGWTGERIEPALMARASSGFSVPDAEEERPGAAAVLARKLEARLSAPDDADSLATALQNELAGLEEDPDTLNQALEILEVRVGHILEEEDSRDRRRQITRRFLRIREQVAALARTGAFHEVTGWYHGAERLNLVIRRLTVAGRLDLLQGHLLAELPGLGMDSFFVGCLEGPAMTGPGDDLQTFGLDLGRMHGGTPGGESILGELPASFPVVVGRIRANPGRAGLIQRPGIGQEPDTQALQAWLDAMGDRPVVALPLTAGDWWLGIFLLGLEKHNAFFTHGIQDILANILDREFRLQELIGITLRERFEHLAGQKRMQAVNSLAAGVAHEVNTPLGVGITALSWLDSLMDSWQRGPTPLPGRFEDARASLELARNGLGKVKNLVDRFRDSYMGGGAPSLRPLDMSSFLKALLISWKQGQPEEYRIHLDVPAGLRAKSDSEVLEKVLRIFLDNVKDHAYPGQDAWEAELTVRQEEKSVVIQLTDQGVGMDTGTLSRVFEPYAANRPGGMGLGMHLAWAMAVMRLGSTPSCSSVPGQGTRVSLELPLA